MKIKDIWNIVDFDNNIIPLRLNMGQLFNLLNCLYRFYKDLFGIDIYDLDVSKLSTLIYYYMIIMNDLKSYIEIKHKHLLNYVKDSSHYDRIKNELLKTVKTF